MTKLNNNTIRFATTKDIENLLPLFKYGYNFHQKNRPDKFPSKKDEELIKTIMDFIKDENTNILVKEDNKKIIGYLAYEVLERITKFIWIDELVIEENKQNKGYAKELLSELDNIAKDFGCKSIEFGCWCFNDNALSIYEHMNYKKQKIIFERKL